jgi:hypothetical protein
MPRPAKNKVNLADLLEGRPAKGNADLYKEGDPEKRKNHAKHRAPRHQLVAGDRYKQKLASSAAEDVRLHELAREFINNGVRQTKAYAAVYGKTISQSRAPASKIFNSTWMRALILDLLQGTDGNLSELPKEYAIQRFIHQIESNVLDYVDDDGQCLSVHELRKLPAYVQQHIKKLDVHTWDEPLEKPNGDIVMIRHQKVHLELIDKQKALEHLAKVMRWIEPKGDTNFFLGADVMIAAQKRVKKLRRDRDGTTLEGKAERVTTD